MLKKLQLAIAFGVALVSATANASLISINTTYNLNDGLIYIRALDNGPVSIANGDHVVLSVGFLNSAALTIGDGNEYFYGWLAAMDNNSHFTIDNATIEFMGFSGTGGAASFYNIGTQSSGMAHLGPYMANFLSAGQSITFNSYKVNYDVQSISQSPHDYGALWFMATGNNLSIGHAQSVPEPSTLMLFGSGLVGLGLFGRRRKG